MEQSESFKKVVLTLQDELKVLTPHDLLILAMSILQVINKMVTFEEKQKENE